MSQLVLKKSSAYWLILPGALWLAVFFLVPLVSQLKTSLEEGTLLTGISFTWHWANYSDAILTYGHIFARSFWYGAIATGIALLTGYPLAYFIVFRGGRLKPLLLFIVIVPFLITYLIRTVAWQGLLTDGGVVISILHALHLAPEGLLILGTSAGVIFGLAYNFLPFMVLPIYVSLERIDRQVLRAASDLYAQPPVVFRKVVFPLSLPGVFAGSLLTFIPAAGDYVNSMMLGGPDQQMIGNIIQARYLVQLDYPLAAAASIILMLALIACVVAYSRLFGTEELTG